jgi:uncharacterized protein YjbI with pentapeptide repeats
LAHLDAGERSTYLSSLRPGSDVDHRGTTFNPALLRDLLNAVRDPDHRPRLGAVRWDRVTFQGRAGFEGATFTGAAFFGKVMFRGATWFGGVTFEKTVSFSEATFKDDAWFGEATFKDEAQFEAATFESRAWFTGAKFEKSAWFDDVRFTGDTRFRGVAFQGGEATSEHDSEFSGATFSSHTIFDGSASAAITDSDGSTPFTQIHSPESRLLDVEHYRQRLETLKGTENYGIAFEKLIIQLLTEAGATLAEKDHTQGHSLGNYSDSVVDFAFIPSDESSNIVLVECKSGRLSEQRLAEAELQLEHLVRERRANLGLVVYNDLEDRQFSADRHSAGRTQIISAIDLLHRLRLTALSQVISDAITHSSSE